MKKKNFMWQIDIPLFTLNMESV